MMRIRRSYLRKLNFLRQVAKRVLLRMIEETVRLKCTYLDRENPMDLTVLREGLKRRSWPA